MDAGELFCHGLYLRQLCSEDRFPDWPRGQKQPILAEFQVAV